MVFESDDDHSCDSIDLPDRCHRGVERLLSRAFCHSDREVLRRSFRPAGSGDDGRASPGLAVSSGADADRRRRQACEVVLRFEAGSVEEDRRAPHGRSGHSALAQLTLPRTYLRKVFQKNGLGSDFLLHSIPEKRYRGVVVPQF